MLFYGDSGLFIFIAQLKCCSKCDRKRDKKSGIFKITKNAYEICIRLWIFHFPTTFSALKKVCYVNVMIQIAVKHIGNSEWNIVNPNIKQIATIRIRKFVDISVTVFPSKTLISTIRYAKLHLRWQCSWQFI